MLPMRYPESGLTACHRTFTTPYAGSLRLCNDSATAASATSSAAAGYWQASATGPDLALLTARDPILFYADVPLYESELDDNGTAQLTVKVKLARFWNQHSCQSRSSSSSWVHSRDARMLKHSIARFLAVSITLLQGSQTCRRGTKPHCLDMVPQVRVMPNCWYVLLRFFLRVDRMFVRLREARLFCDLRQVIACRHPPPHLHRAGRCTSVLHVHLKAAGRGHHRAYLMFLQPTRLVRELKHSEAALTALSGGSARGRGVSGQCSSGAGSSDHCAHLILDLVRAVIYAQHVAFSRDSASGWRACSAGGACGC